MKNSTKKIMICMMSTIILLSTSVKTTVLATEVNDVVTPNTTTGNNNNNAGAAEELFVTGYTVTNETITPGEDFMLTITFENFSTVATADRALVIVNNPEGVVPEYGTVSQEYLRAIRPGDTAEVSFKYSTDATLTASNLNFTVSISSEAAYSSTQIRIPVGRMVDFNTEDVYVPEKFAVNTTQYVSAAIENMGNTGVTNVVMVARSDREDIASSNIGAIAAGTSKTQSLSIEYEEAGTYIFDLVLTYTNSDGEDKEYVIASDRIDVVEENMLSNVEISDTEVQSDNANNGYEEVSSNNIVFVCVSGLLLVMICCVILILIYKRK